jgi:L-gulonolactone oxidase
MASLCGLGSTGLLLSIQLEVEPAFRLKETWEQLPFNSFIEHLDELAASGEHVRLQWFPQTEEIRIGTSDRTREVI